MKKRITLKQMTLTGLMAAAVYVASALLQIPIPTAIDNTRLYMGNVMCLMAWVCGKIAFLSKPGRNVRFGVSSLCGSVLYVFLYLSKSFVEHYFVLRLPMEAVLLTLSQKAIVSGANAVVAVCVAVPLGLSLQSVIRKITL